VPEPLVVLLDQNIPRAIASWLRSIKSGWVVHHTSEVALSGQTDEAVFTWAIRNKALIISFDEDFADGRSFRVWPTTTEVSEDELTGALVIVDSTRIRIRPRRK
jgi:predicted nuclease of predicted toxin-antitoxin system